MKYNNKMLVAALAIAAVGVLVYSQKASAPVVSEGSVVGTYVAHGSKIVYTLDIASQQGESVSGNLDIQNYQKDNSNGPVVGTYKDGILLADYTFQSEGTTSVNQVIFKKEGDDFVRGYGELDSSGTRFADPSKVTFDSSVVYKKVPSDAHATSTGPSSSASTGTSTSGSKPTNIGAQGKLNINVVCEGALAYMTFKDGASADAFVAECKEGKHPEVIEHFKAQMNLGDGATI